MLFDDLVLTSLKLPLKNFVLVWNESRWRGDSLWHGQVLHSNCRQGHGSGQDSDRETERIALDGLGSGKEVQTFSVFESSTTINHHHHYSLALYYRTLTPTFKVDVWEFKQKMAYMVIYGYIEMILTTLYSFSKF